ncbi:hypothetical protein MNB_ARC-1_1135 [hydrothermal vent metagenome]|uniref:Uncharacterized protein n=1 Tax=hydrothermal vent metagenome TaxID=652676 RepID=A0A3B1DU92_9ZZZZ
MKFLFILVFVFYSYLSSDEIDRLAKKLELINKKKQEFELKKKIKPVVKVVLTEEQKEQNRLEKARFKFDMLKSFRLLKDRERKLHHDIFLKSRENVLAKMKYELNSIDKSTSPIKQMKFKVKIESLIENGYGTILVVNAKSYNNALALARKEERKIVNILNTKEEIKRLFHIRDTEYVKRKFSKLMSVINDNRTPTLYNMPYTTATATATTSINMDSSTKQIEENINLIVENNYLFITVR